MISSIFAAICASVTSLFAAIKGFQIESLFLWFLVQQILLFIGLSFSCRLSPKWSKNLILKLIPFSMTIFFVSLLDVINTYFINLLIYKKYTISEVGKYNRSRYFPDLFNSVFSSTFIRVLLPYYANTVQDRTELVKFHIKVLKHTLVLTALVLLVVNIIYLVLKLFFNDHSWFELYCYISLLLPIIIFYSIDAMNMVFLRAMYKADIILKIELYKKAISVIVIFMFFVNSIDLINFINAIVGLAFANLAVGSFAIYVSLDLQRRYVIWTRLRENSRLFIFLSLGLVVFYYINSLPVKSALVLFTAVLLFGVYLIHNKYSNLILFKRLKSNHK
jgi:O-antigen/teichoic acid export membrane protein